MKLTAYEDAKGFWRWKITSKNGKIVAASSEGFSSLAKCRKNAGLSFDGLYEHLDRSCCIEFSNESELAAMGKKPAKTANGAK